MSVDWLKPGYLDTANNPPFLATLTSYACSLPSIHTPQGVDYWSTPLECIGSAIGVILDNAKKSEMLLNVLP